MPYLNYRQVISKVWNSTKVALMVDKVITKTIQTELKAITAVAADVQSVSSTLD